jgi:hypothetical protein
MLFLAFLSDFWAKNREKFAPKYFFESLNTRYVPFAILIEKNMINEIECMIWKHEFNKSEWEEIVEKIKNSSFEYYYENDWGELKHTL